MQHYLRRFSRELGREVREVAPEALERLRGYSWPGNIRELQSVLKQALLQASGPVLLPALPARPRGRARRPDRRRSPPAAGDPDLEAFIRLCLACDDGDLYAESAPPSWTGSCCPASWKPPRGNQQQAARMLGIARETLRREAPRAGAPPQPPV